MIDTLYNNYSNLLYQQLNEMLKTYRVFESFDKQQAGNLLAKINELRLSIALIAEQRQIFWKQINVPANASGYKNDLYFTSDDIKSLVSRFVANLGLTTSLSLTQQGIKENIFTRQAIPYQQLASAVQSVTTGQAIPFDLPQEIFLDKNDSLDFGIKNQTSAGQIIVHGCNLKDDYSPSVDALRAEINRRDERGNPFLPQTALIPIQFKFTAGAVGNQAVAVDDATNIFSIKNPKSIILTDVSTTSINSRITLIDRGRNQTLCETVESQGVAGFFQNRFTVYYPLPYWHILRASDRLELQAVNGSNITGTFDAANDIQTLCFRGFYI